MSIGPTHSLLHALGSGVATPAAQRHAPPAQPAEAAIATARSEPPARPEPARERPPVSEAPSAENRATAEPGRRLDILV